MEIAVILFNRPTPRLAYYKEVQYSSDYQKILQLLKESGLEPGDLGVYFFIGRSISEIKDILERKDPYFKEEVRVIKCWEQFKNKINKLN